MTRMTEEEYRRLQAKGREIANSAFETMSKEVAVIRGDPSQRRKKGDMQKRKGPNKTEAAFGEWLKRNSYEAVRFEAITLRMPGGTRYTPDWQVVDYHNPYSDPAINYYEVKGFMREAARVRLKEFAAYFEECRFFLVRAKNRALTEWQITEV